jgi:hypothetical protein
MKTSVAPGMRSMAAFVALLASAGLFSGCTQWNERNVPLDSKPASYAELETRAAQGTTGGSTPAPMTPTSPRKAYEIYSRAIQDGNFETCWQLLSSGTQKVYDADAMTFRDRIQNPSGPDPDDLELLHLLGLTVNEVDKVDGKMLLVAKFRRQSARNPQQFRYIARTEFDHEDIWGDQAKVYVRAGGKPEPNPMKLVREGGMWRFVLTRTPPSTSSP